VFCGKDREFSISGNWLPDTVIDSTPSFDLDAAGIAPSFTSSVGPRLSVGGYLRTPSAGTLAIRGARSSSNTTIDMNIREGSYLIARPVN